MSYLIILIIILLSIIILKTVIGSKISDIKKISKNKELDDITNKLPENIEVCKKILTILKNQNVNIKENKENESSFYFVATNTINIANIRDSYTRIQTIAHECIHSIQDKKILWFNYLFSNLYLLYFIAICIMTIWNPNENGLIYICIFLILTCIWLFVRIFLETDAMTRARYLSENYLIQEKKLLKDEEIEKLLNQYDNLNYYGIKLANFQLFFSSMMRLIIYLILVLVTSM